MGVSGHEFARAAFDSTISGAINIKDPGTGKTLDFGDNNDCFCNLTVAAAAETRSLPTASAFKEGVRFTVVVNQLTTAGSHYVTVESIRMSVEGDYVTFMTMKINDAIVWTPIYRGGSLAPPLLPPVTLAVSTTLVSALHANRPLFMSGAGGARTFTLPTASGSGDRYEFIVAAVNATANGYKIGNSGTQLNGGVIFNSTGDAADAAIIAYNTSGGATDYCTLNGTTTGGALIGDHLIFHDFAALTYSVRGVLTGSGTEATPFG